MFTDRRPFRQGMVQGLGFFTLPGLNNSCHGSGHHLTVALSISVSLSLADYVCVYVRVRTGDEE